MKKQELSGVTHTHNGVAHTHELPKDGLRHSHGLDNAGITHTHNGVAHTHHLSDAGFKHSHCDVASGNYVIFKSGDGVYRLAVNNGVKRDDIIRLNNLQAPDYIAQPGQCLRIR